MKETVDENIHEFIFFHIKHTIFLKFTIENQQKFSIAKKKNNKKKRPVVERVELQSSQTNCTNKMVERSGFVCHYR